MSKSNTSAPKCMVCGFNHWLRDPHKWGDEPKKKDIIERLKVRVGTQEALRRVHKSKKDDKVYTMRKIGIRELRANLSRELSDLPFDIIKNGKVIARVDKI